MAKKISYEVGMRFGRLVVLGVSRVPCGRQVTTRAIVQCDCGSPQKRVLAQALRDGKTASCGCLNSELAAARKRTHGMRHTRLYNVWNTMKQRIANPNTEKYPIYGGRGLDISPEWFGSFEAFYRDMGQPPTAKHSIERIDNNKGYWPGNCRWATAAEQGLNKRSNINIVVDGETLILSAACRRVGVSDGKIYLRMRLRGETHQQAFDHLRARASDRAFSAAKALGT